MSELSNNQLIWPVTPFSTGAPVGAIDIIIPVDPGYNYLLEFEFLGPAAGPALTISVRPNGDTAQVWALDETVSTPSVTVGNNGGDMTISGTGSNGQVAGHIEIRGRTGLLRFVELVYVKGSVATLLDGVKRQTGFYQGVAALTHIDLIRTAGSYQAPSRWSLWKMNA